MEATSAAFRCAKCGRPYEWKPEFVGKTGQCPCGHAYKIPAPPQEANPVSLAPHEQLNEPVPEAEAAIVSLYNPVENSGRARAPMELPNEELDASTEAELKELASYGDNRDQFHKPNPYLDFTLPLILLGIGLMLAFGEASYMTHRHHFTLLGAVSGLSLRLVLQVVLMIIGMLAAGKFTGINFGNIPSAILKVAAIYIAPTTLGALLAAVLGGDAPYHILGWGVSVVLYWALLGYLFRLDASQTLACVFCIGILRLMTQMFVLGAMY